MATYYWVGGTGTWDASTTTNWAATSGGAGGVGPPTASDNATFDGSSGSGTVTTAAGATANVVTLNNVNISIVLGAALTTTAGFFLTTGTLNLNSFNANFNDFSASNSTARTISSGTGQFFITGQNATVLNINTVTNLTYTDRATYNLSSAPSSGTRLAQHGFISTEALMPNINVSAGTDTITLNGFWYTVNFTGFSGTLNNNGRNIYGNLTVSTGMTLTAGTGKTDFRGTAAGKTITTSGKTFDFPLEFVGTGSVWSLQDNLTVGSTRLVTLSAGTLNANGNNVSLGTFASTGTTARTLTIGSGTWTVEGSGATAWNTATTGLTITASTGAISMTSASAKTFVGSGKTWPTLNQAGAGALTITGNNTFANITNSVQPTTVTLTAGSTQTVTSFTLSGTAGSLVTLNSSSAGSQATLTDSTGTNTVTNTDIKDIAAAGGATWLAYTADGNVDSGNNTGWVFASTPAFLYAEFPQEIRSFTEKRRF